MLVMLLFMNKQPIFLRHYNIGIVMFVILFPWQQRLLLFVLIYMYSINDTN